MTADPTEGISNRYLNGVEDDYIKSIGRATYVFACLEWNVVYCCERIEPGCLPHIMVRTAGLIADAFVQRASGLADPDLRAECQAEAIEFKRLVRRRNDLMHSNPGMNPEDKQRLFREGAPLEIKDIDRMADEFAAHALVLNALLYGGLANLNSGSGAI